MRLAQAQRAERRQVERRRVEPCCGPLSPDLPHHEPRGGRRAGAVAYCPVGPRRLEWPTRDSCCSTPCRCLHSRLAPRWVVALQGPAGPRRAARQTDKACGSCTAAAAALTAGGRAWEAAWAAREPPQRHSEPSCPRPPPTHDPLRSRCRGWRNPPARAQELHGASQTRAGVGATPGRRLPPGGAGQVSMLPHTPIWHWRSAPLPTSRAVVFTSV